MRWATLAFLMISIRQFRQPLPTMRVSKLAPASLQLPCFPIKWEPAISLAMRAAQIITGLIHRMPANRLRILPLHTSHHLWACSEVDRRALPHMLSPESSISNSVHYKINRAIPRLFFVFIFFCQDFLAFGMYMSIGFCMRSGMASLYFLNINGKAFFSTLDFFCHGSGAVGF